MLAVVDIIFAAFPTKMPDMHLFEGKITTTGFIILFIFIAGLVLFAIIAALRAWHAKRMENFPPIYGDANELLEQISDITGLGLSERWILRKLARDMKISQPAAIILSPELLSQANKVWRNSHKLATTKSWGTSKLDYISRQIFNIPVSKLQK